MNGDDSQCVEKGPCDECGSSDANALYDDGHRYCFRCGHYTPPDGEPTQTRRRMAKGLERAGSYIDLTKRRIPSDVCAKYGYSGRDGLQIAPYYDSDGQLVAQKIRRPGKEFYVAGDMKSACLFGQKLFRHGGKRLVIFEGEIDAMSGYRMMNGWPAVSIRNGANGAVKDIQANLEFVESYDEVVLCFDNDEPGREAAQAVAEMLTPGKAKIASLPLKDANDMLVAGRSKEFMSAIFEAQVRRPDGIVNMAEVWDRVSTAPEMGAAYPWEPLTKMLYGLRGGEITLIAAGSGVGKSAIAAEIAYGLLMAGETVGYVALEEGIRRTGLRFMSLHANKPLHKPGVEATEEERRAAFDATLGTGRLFSYDHFGSLDGDNLMGKLRYLVKGCGVRWIVLDHISIVVSGLEANADERREIDRLMTKLRSFAEETGVGFLIISHLTRADGRPHEEGGRVTLGQLRGSGSLAQLSDNVIGGERNQQADDEAERNTTTLRVLKNRLYGETGVACRVLYSKETDRLTTLEDEEETSQGDPGEHDF